MSEAKIRILSMLESGKITVEQAEQLLSAVDKEVQDNGVDNLSQEDIGRLEDNIAELREEIGNGNNGQDSSSNIDELVQEITNTAEKIAEKSGMFAKSVMGKVANALSSINIEVEGKIDLSNLEDMAKKCTTYQHNCTTNQDNQGVTIKKGHSDSKDYQSRQCYIKVIQDNFHFKYDSAIAKIDYDIMYISQEIKDIIQSLITDSFVGSYKYVNGGNIVKVVIE